MAFLSNLLVSGFPKSSENIFFTKKDCNEPCVICSEETPYKFSDHLEERENYVEGAGQLCGNCYLENCVEKPKRIPDYLCE